MSTSTHFKSRVKDLQDLKNHYVYILNKKFYGKEPDSTKPKTAWELRFYSHSDVRNIVKTTLLISDDFVENEISDRTTLLIVPDDWDRTLPLSKQKYAERLIYIPFSYVLHPDVVNLDEMVHLTAPHNAEYQIMLREQHRKPHVFVLNEVTPDNIMERFQGWRFNALNEHRDFVSGHASMLNEQNRTYQSPWNAPTPSAVAKPEAKKASIKKKTSVKKEELPVNPLNSKKKPSLKKQVADVGEKMKETGKKIEKTMKETGQKIKESLERPVFTAKTRTMQESTTTRATPGLRLKARTPSMCGATRTLHWSEEEDNASDSSNDEEKMRAHAGTSRGIPDEEEEEDDDDEDAVYNKAWGALVARAKAMQANSLDDSD